MKHATLPANTIPAKDFSEILQLIQLGQIRAFHAVNVALIDTYWQVGKYLSHKMADGGWGKGVVKELALWLAETAPELKGFSAQNLWRMKQFYEAYHNNEKLSILLRELSWTHHCILLAQCKTDDERSFYANACARSEWSKRELENQIKRGNFERTLLADQKLSPVVRELPQRVIGVFKDSYLLDFLDLPDPYSEHDLQAGLVRNLCKFLIELGTGFSFVGEKVRLQVGNSDFELDLLFYHRDLQCLVAFELKTGKFEPAHLGQLSFYLEALDRDHKLTHENPSIGVLLCRNKDDEVVEYALSRTLSPALVAEYEHRLISKALLKQKMHEWTALIEGRVSERVGDDKE
jgi:predicted nuclease of restriction endonuclease-like (RecB) superfamily